MKLYYASSVCSLAVRIVIHELEIECDYESVDLKTKRTDTGGDFLIINPKGAVPALQLDNGDMLTENAVILQYLADTYHATELLPPVHNMTRYRILEWLNFVSTDLHRYCAPLFWSKIPDELKESFFRPIFNSKLLVVEKHLQEHHFLIGDQLTLADCYLFVIVIWMLKLKIDMTTWPNLSCYFVKMKQQKSVQLSLTEEHLQGLNLQ